MRYKDTGMLHPDFHISTDAAIKFVLGRYGEDMLKELFRRTAHLVYKDIHVSLMSGNPEPLVEHWDYYFKREGGEFEIIRNGDEIILEVKTCPAVKHLISRHIKPEPCFCLQTSLLNEAFAEGTPFEITTEILGTGVCRQVIRRKCNDSK